MAAVKDPVTLHLEAAEQWLAKAEAAWQDAQPSAAIRAAADIAAVHASLAGTYTAAGMRDDSRRMRDSLPTRPSRGW